MEKRIYELDTLETEGFIHFSNLDQVVPVADYLYKGENDLILLCVDENKTEHKMVFEDLKGHGVFPHLYGPLNSNEVEKVYEFPCDDDGSFSLPADLES